MGRTIAQHVRLKTLYNSKTSYAKQHHDLLNWRTCKQKNQRLIIKVCFWNTAHIRYDEVEVWWRQTNPMLCEILTQELTSIQFSNPRHPWPFSPPPPQPRKVPSILVPASCSHMVPEKNSFQFTEILSLQKIMYCVMENDCKTNFWYHSHTKHSVKTLIYCCVVLTGVYVLRCISNVFLTLMTTITTQCHKTGWNHVLDVRSHHQTFHKSLRTWVCPKF